MSQPRTKRNPSTEQKEEKVELLHQHYEGVIPPPVMMKEYNLIIPDAAERILTMAENEAKHRHALESQATQANIDDRVQARSEIRLGQILSFTLCTMVVLLGGFTIYLGHSIAGSLLSATSLATIILAFVGKK